MSFKMKDKEKALWEQRLKNQQNKYENMRHDYFSYFECSWKIAYLQNRDLTDKEKAIRDRYLLAYIRAYFDFLELHSKYANWLLRRGYINNV